MKRERIDEIRHGQGAGRLASVFYPSMSAFEMPAWLLCPFVRRTRKYKTHSLPHTLGQHYVNLLV